MHYLYVRHKVEDYDKWYAVFKSNEEAQQKAGFKDLHLMRDVDDPDIVVVFFRVEDLEKARAFTQEPEAYEAMKESGVIGEPLGLWLQEI
ncbi:MAG: cyclase [Planctomycetota bacterium]|jgi:heme-degrading monooxygenase HmoA